MKDQSKQRINSASKFITTESMLLSFDIEKLKRGDPILNLIGNTPTIHLNRLTEKDTGDIFIKLEGSNPSGSLKDRPALFMLQEAIYNKWLQPGMRALDASSGNMASAIALIAKRLGYSSSFVLGNTATKEKVALLKFLGAEIIHFDGNTWESSHEAEKIAKRFPEKYCFLDQFHNPANLRAHYHTTGPEILEETPDLDVFIASLGSGGSVCGAGRFLKENTSKIKVIAVTAETGTRIPGLRNLEEEGFVPPLANMNILDDIIRVNEINAIKTVKLILEKESILLSPQGGAVVWAAMQVLEKSNYKKVVALMGDASWKNIDVLLRKLIE